MAKKYPLHVCPRAAFAATATLLGVLASPLACSSDSGDDTSEETTRDSAPAPSPTVVRERDDARAAPDTSGQSDSASVPAADEGAAGAAAETSGAADSAPDAPPMAASAAAAQDAVSPAPTAAQTFQACSIAQGIYAGACNTIYVTMQQAEPPLCVQLTVDNCGSYNRQGLSVDTPPSWRLASGSIGDTPAPCKLGEFYPDRALVADASGSISWNETTRRPSELVLDVTLERAASSGQPVSIDVATTAPLEPLPCPD